MLGADDEVGVVAAAVAGPRVAARDGVREVGQHARRLPRLTALVRGTAAGKERKIRLHSDLFRDVSVIVLSDLPDPDLLTQIVKSNPCPRVTPYAHVSVILRDWLDKSCKTPPYEHTVQSLLRTSFILRQCLSIKSIK